MALFKRGSKTPSGADGRPSTGAVPKGGYGSYGTPSRAQKMSAKKGKPQGGRKGTPAHKPKGSYGTYGKPNQNASRPQVNMSEVGKDGMAVPKSPIPTDKRKLFNMPKGKFTY